MAPTTLHVKATSGSKITVEVELTLTVGDLKAVLAAEDKANVPAVQQRLIYKGHVLKDEKDLASYGACHLTSWQTRGIACTRSSSSSVLRVVGMHARSSFPWRYALAVPPRN
jgi:hypothetical protein